MYAYQLEPFPATELDKHRRRVEKCPCGRSNKDGKFVPFIGFEDRGYCHSCGQCFRVGNHTCPHCRMPHAFNRYIAVESNTYVNEKVGRCLLCNYHLPPKQYFAAKEQGAEGENIESVTQPQVCPVSPPEPKKPQPQQVSFISHFQLERSLNSPEENSFIQYLDSLLGPEHAAQAVQRYKIGTSSYLFRRAEFPWYRCPKGAAVFWQIDTEGNVRTGKVMLYDPNTGKRVKEPFNHVHWMHSLLKQSNFHLQQCFFGEHLLCTEPGKPVAIVESEKTAVIASLYLPQFLWIACGSLAGLSTQKCQVLTGRDVVLFPDLEGFEKWSVKAKELSHITRFRVSDLLEKRASAFERGGRLDLADYLVKFPIERFLNS